jgi:hypothetical protein
VLQRSLVSKIMDHETHRCIWIGSYQSAAQAAWAYDIQAVRLHSAARLPLRQPQRAGFGPNRPLMPPSELREDRGGGLRAPRDRAP